jgi:hypothetical protein
MKKRSLRFFLDYGICFWAANYDEGFSGGLMAEDLPLTPETQQQVKLFLREFDASYNYGLPPYMDMTIEDCRRFNRELHRILTLVIPELGSQFTLCLEQMELTEDADVLAELHRRGREFYDEHRVLYYPNNGVDEE